MDKKGNVVVDYIYDDAREQNEYGYASVKKNGMWGMFRIKRQPKHEPEIISTLEPIYYNSEEALLAFKNSKHNTVRKHKRTKNATTEESKENFLGSWNLKNLL